MRNENEVRNLIKLCRKNLLDYFEGVFGTDNFKHHRRMIFKHLNCLARDVDMNNRGGRHEIDQEKSQ